MQRERKTENTLSHKISGKEMEAGQGSGKGVRIPSLQLCAGFCGSLNRVVEMRASLLKKPELGSSPSGKCYYRSMISCSKVLIQIAPKTKSFS